MDRLFKVLFNNQGQVYEVYVRHVAHSDLAGFVEISEFVFGEKTQIVVDPAEERLKSEFSGVTRSLIPFHQVIRIDQVEKSGTPGIQKETQRPVTLLTLPNPPKS
ncbi:MAG: DUF1820 family protein [Myxococcales bacterium]|nr:DUF1820 family protein [Myxococcales bacterium]